MRPTRTWHPATLPRLAALVAGLVLLTACGLPTDDTARPVPPDQLPPALQTDSSVTTSTTLVDSTARPATIYLVNEEGILQSRTRSLEIANPDSLPATLAALFEAVLAGPTAEEQEDQGLSSLVPDGSALVSPPVVGGMAGFADDTVPLDLNDAFFDNLEGDRASRAAAQLVFTLTSQAAVESVTFLRNGEPQTIRTSAGDVPEAPREMTRADFVAFDPLATPPTTSP